VEIGFEFICGSQKSIFTVSLVPPHSSMPSVRHILASFALFFLNSVTLWSQVPDTVMPAPAPVPFVRPDLSPATWDLSGVTLNEEQQDELVAVLVSLVRDYPKQSAVTMAWKSRLLAIALRLRPEHRNGMIACGQLARGVLPKPLQASPPPLDRPALALLKFATVLLDNASDKASPNYVLGYHLLDAAVQFDKSNRLVQESFSTDAPALKWAALAPKTNSRNSIQEEETPDLRKTSSAIQTFLFADPRGTSQPELQTVMCEASRQPNGGRQSMELLLPKNLDKTTEAALPQIRQLLQLRHAQWPGGWRVDVKEFGIPNTAQAGVPLSLALLLDSMLGGYELEPHTYVACGLESSTGKIVRTFSVETLLKISASLPADAIVIVSEMDMTEVQDLLIVSPERWTEFLAAHWCVARNIGECAALLTNDRPPTLQRNLQDGASLIHRIRQGGLASLRSETTTVALAELLKSYPNDQTATVLEMIALKKFPAQLSLVGALNVLGRLGVPVTHAGSRNYNPSVLWKDKLSATPWNKCKIQIDRLRPLLPPEAKAYADGLVDLAKMYDAMALYPPISNPVRLENERRVRDARVRLRDVYQEFRLKVPKRQTVTAEAPALPVPPAADNPGQPMDGEVVPR
jgi:hypothetical protein